MWEGALGFWEDIAPWWYWLRAALQRRGRNRGGEERRGGADGGECVEREERDCVFAAGAESQGLC